MLSFLKYSKRNGKNVRGLSYLFFYLKHTLIHYEYIYLVLRYSLTWYVLVIDANQFFYIEINKQ